MNRANALQGPTLSVENCQKGEEIVEKLPQRWLSEEEQELWRSYLGAWFRLARVLNDDLERNSGFDHLTYEIFVNLSESTTRSLRMTDLAKSVSVNKSRLTYRIGQLEVQGLVSRTECEEDGRGHMCVLTDKGFAILEKAAPHHVQAVLTNFIDAIDPSEVAELISVLNKIAPGVAPRGVCEQ